MNKKLYKIAGTVFAALALASLALPVYRTNIEDGESWLCILRGFNMIEFSIFGVLTVLMPIAFIIFGCIKISQKVRRWILGGLLVLAMICLLLADGAMSAWVCEIATGAVENHKSLFVYAGLLIAETAFFAVTRPTEK